MSVAWEGRVGTGEVRLDSLPVGASFILRLDIPTVAEEVR